MQWRLKGSMWFCPCPRRVLSLSCALPLVDVPHSNPVATIQCITSRPFLITIRATCSWSLSIGLLRLYLQSSLRSPRPFSPHHFSLSSLPLFLLALLSQAIAMVAPLSPVLPRESTNPLDPTALLLAPHGSSHASLPPRRTSSMLLIHTGAPCYCSCRSPVADVATELHLVHAPPHVASPSWSRHHPRPVSSPLASMLESIVPCHRRASCPQRPIVAAPLSHPSWPFPLPPARAHHVSRC